MTRGRHNRLCVGKVISSKNYGDYEVVDVKENTAKIKFFTTGYEDWFDRKLVNRGVVKDPLFPKVFGVGFMGVGNYVSMSNGVRDKAYVAWKGMLERCYCKNSQERSPSYIGCKVCEEWHNYQNFAKWFYDNLPSDLDKPQVDKDIRSPDKVGKIYSPERCKLVSSSENNEAAHASSYRLVSPSGEIVDVYNLAKFCKDKNLNRGNLNSVMLGRRKSCQGWKAFNAKKILEQCIDTKNQRVVSIERLASVLGVEPLTKQEVNQLIESRKAAHLKEGE